MKTLIVVESPTKAREVSHILGPQFVVLASFGHVRDLPKNEMGVEPPSFRLKYVPTERGGAQLTKIRAAAKSADRILLATDPDREGEAIAWHVADALQLPARKTGRISYNEITERAVKAAVANPRPLDMHLVHAQEARRGIDRLVGYTISPVMGRGLSAGRVQTPALRLLVERERLIQAHQKVKHFGAELTLPPTNAKGTDWTAAWDPQPWLKDGAEHCLDRTLAARAANVQEVTVASVKEHLRTRNAPAPFTSSTLQQAASSRLNISPGETMKIAQRLFESTFITYHRTDSVAMAQDAVDEIRAYAKKHGLPLPATANTHKSKGPSVQGAHECIRPTRVDLEAPRGLTAREQAVYDLIRKQAIASQLAPMTADVTDVVLESARNPKDERPFTYKAQGVRVKSPGWTTVLGDADDKVLPDNLTVGRTLTVTAGRVLELETKPPARYTEAALIKELERLGIGRPSTYAAIIETLKYRDYARLQAKVLIPTAVGMSVADALVRCSFYDLAYTAQMEQTLDELAEGHAEYTKVMADAFGSVQCDATKVGKVAMSTDGNVAGIAGRTPHSGGNVAGARPSGIASAPKRRSTKKTSQAKRRPGRAGAKTPRVARGQKCHPCGHCGPHGPGQCPLCGGALVKRKSQYGVFLGCANYPRCKGKG